MYSTTPCLEPRRCLPRAQPAARLTVPPRPLKIARPADMSAPGIAQLVRQSVSALAQGQLPPMEVLKPLISKVGGPAAAAKARDPRSRELNWCPQPQGLGYAILAGACITKLPQVRARIGAAGAPPSGRAADRPRARRSWPSSRARARRASA
jgi:hypothetical protein